jgi:hypothetical protein
VAHLRSGHLIRCRRPPWREVEHVIGWSTHPESAVVDPRDAVPVAREMPTLLDCRLRSPGMRATPGRSGHPLISLPTQRA